ncbi:fatty acid desaturase [Streptomyces sp. M19]
MLLVLHWVGYATLLLSAMSPGKAIVFALVQHALFGLHLGMAFAPNHKGMEMPDPDGDRWGHLQRQVLTSRNVRGGALTDWFLGGLNYQIEHHLFPSMPRPTCAAPSRWYGTTARPWTCPTPRPASSTPTPRRCATCTTSAIRSARAHLPPEARMRHAGKRAGPLKERGARR